MITNSNKRPYIHLNTRDMWNKSNYITSYGQGEKYVTDKQQIEQ